jgi:uncharacterized protein (TIGR00290 family)
MSVNIEDKPMQQEDIVLFWSGGKDSALALLYILEKEKYKVKALITTINKETNTVAFHGISEQLLVQQAKLIGIPLHRVYVPNFPDNKTYNQILEKVLESYKKRGIKKVAFGDIHLEDIRKYREHQLSKIGLESYFPLWNIDEKELIDTLFNKQFRVVITSVMTEKLSHAYLAKEINPELLKQLPKEVDPLGENGEFHTIVTYAPYFKGRLQTSISITKQEGPYQVCQVRLP